MKPSLSLSFSVKSIYKDTALIEILSSGATSTEIVTLPNKNWLLFYGKTILESRLKQEMELKSLWT